ncbi:MAG: phosphatase PAP2 family protein [Tenuifilaceae bacterium]|jgi:undecaprenyl-diphosphatase|nr:phosphatase PAP2 family protein [Tenuifilaceae bacterium]
MISWLQQVDTEFFLYLNGLGVVFWDPIMIFFSGKLTWLPFYLILVYLMYRRFGWRLVWPLLGAALVVTLADQSSVHLFKNVFERLRPCHEASLQELIRLPTGRCAGGRFGFVSSHAANTFGVAVFLANLFKRRWFTAMIIIWAAGVSYSRIYLGVHYPGDVIGGALLGAVCGYAVWNLLYGLDKTFGLLAPRKA